MFFSGFLFAQKNAKDPMFSKKKVNKTGAYEDKRYKKKPPSVVIAQEFDAGQKNYKNPRKAARKAEKETRRIQDASARDRDRYNRKVRKGNMHVNSMKPPKSKKPKKVAKAASDK